MKLEPRTASSARPAAARSRHGQAPRGPGRQARAAGIAAPPSRRGGCRRSWPCSPFTAAVAGLVLVALLNGPWMRVTAVGLGRRRVHARRRRRSAILDDTAARASWPSTPLRCATASSGAAVGGGRARIELRLAGRLEATVVERDVRPSCGDTAAGACWSAPPTARSSPRAAARPRARPTGCAGCRASTTSASRRACCRSATSCRRAELRAALRV